jgi:hypothetical protein
MGCLIASSKPASAQGELTPTSPPAATMKSLQELWDEMRSLRSRVDSSQASSEALLLNIARAQGLNVSNVWQTQRADTNENIGSYTSLAFTPAGQPAISYYNDSPDDLMYAEYDGSAWQTQTVDSANDVGRYTSLAFTPAGRPAISYFDADAGGLKYAQYDGTTWQTESVDTAGDVGRHTSLAFSPAGRPAISYWAGNFDFDLKYAEYDGSAWQTQTVDTNGNVGKFTSLAFTPAGRPAISYFDADLDDLKYAEVNAVVITP